MIQSHAELIRQHQDSDKIDDITGAILAGGTSSRMGSDKALLLVDGIPIIEAIHRKLAALFQDVIIVTNNPDAYDFIPCRKVPDIHPGAGPIAGVHSALLHGANRKVFVVACDMPLLNVVLIRHLCNVEGDWDAVVPVNAAGYLEPLHALYNRTAINEVQRAMDNGDNGIMRLFDRLGTRKVTWEEIEGIRGAGDSFRNINTPQEYDKI